MKMNNEQRKQAMQASNAQPNMRVIQNGGVSEAVNFAVEDFYKAAIVLKRATKNYTVAFADLPRGVQFFAQQQFFRLNGAGLMLDALGYQSVTEVMAIVHNDAAEYMQASMAEWNKVIESEGDVERMFAEIAAEEKAAGTPGMQ